MTRIFDCFLYSDEKELLSIRLRLLSEVVHQFVIVSSRQTFSGAKRRATSPAEIVASLGLGQKVQLIELEELRGDNAWAREWFSRDALGRGLQTAHESDLILVSDVDEIPRPSVLAQLASLGDDRRVVLGLDYFNFKFNYQLMHGLEAVWPGPVACRLKGFTSGQGIRNLRDGLLEAPDCLVDDAGWHFSFLTTGDDVRTKLANYAHTEQEMQTRGSASVEALIANRQGFKDHLHPGSVWAIVELASLRNLTLEQLAAQQTRFVAAEPPDDASVVNRRIRHAVRGICWHERDKILRQATWKELARCLVSRAGHKATRTLRRAGSFVS